MLFRSLEGVRTEGDSPRASPVQSDEREAPLRLAARERAILPSRRDHDGRHIRRRTAERGGREDRSDDGGGEEGEKAAHTCQARVAGTPFAGKGEKPSVDRILTPVRMRSLRVFLFALAALSLLVPSVAVGQGEPPRVLAVHLDNDINPVTQEYLENAIDRAEDEEFSAVVVVLDTPGGLGSSMRGIVKRFLASRVPVILYVAPPGSSADSAGAVIAMAADIAAMAPQTNIGSSTPISLGGQDISKDLRRKIVNDAAAYVGELAREHGRNVRAARQMVTKASNYGARQARQIGLVEVVAGTLPTLLNEIDGMKTVPKGLVLDTAGAEVEDVEMSFWQRARDLLVDPNLIALMLSIGLLGIVVELWNPGLIFPGTVGAISLILGLYGLQVLQIGRAHV